MTPDGREIEPGDGMTEPRRTLCPCPRPVDISTRRAQNLARRLLQLERECRGRGRVEIQVIMLMGSGC